MKPLEEMTNAEIAAEIESLELSAQEDAALQAFMDAADRGMDEFEKELGRSLTNRELVALSEELINQYDRGEQPDTAHAYYTKNEPLDLDKDADRTQWMREKLEPLTEPPEPTELPLDATDAERQQWIRDRVQGVPVEPDAAPAGE